MGWVRPVKSAGVETIGWGEWASLLDDSLKLQAEYFAGLVPYVLSRLLARSKTSGPRPELVAAPTTDWAVAALDVATTTMGIEGKWLLHSERSWQFAAALAAAMEEELDPELLYVASLLHDVGLFDADRRECFAAVGSRIADATAITAGVDDHLAKTVSRAIFSHISVRPDNRLGWYVQAGTLMDLIGSRVWLVDRGLVERICAERPRAGFPAEARRRWAEECDRFPNGRAAYARFPGCLSAATYLSPLPRA